MAAAKAQTAGEMGRLTSTAGSPTPQVLRLIIRNADLTLRVDTVDAAERKVARIARSVGGDLEGSQGTDLSGPSPSLTVTLRVPENRFEEAISQLESLGVRLGKTVRTEDVTTQAVDMDARLKSLRVQEDAYRAILSAARKISDVLEVQERLTGVRTEIEQIVAQRRNLGDKAARSTIAVNLTQVLKPAAAAAEPDWARQSWGEATGALRGFGQALATVAIWGTALIPIWLPVGLVLLFALRRGRKEA